MALLHLFSFPRFGLKEHSFSKLFPVLLQREKNIASLTFRCLFKVVWITSWPKQATQLTLITIGQVDIIFSCEEHWAFMTMIVYNDPEAEGKRWMQSLSSSSYKEEERTPHTPLHYPLATI